ncbi:unnamed protein product [Linum trigynum]|uniref:Uncharacterized protein n=1 Tax=Linum trigynum TaxID=586398 RepID=A0AAV2EUH0_9ROSI
MTSVIGWYGPQVDLCRVASHVGDFVQLVVFVHRCTPVQYKLPKGGETVRTDIQVGDETHPFFVVSLWQKQTRNVAAAGDVVLLQNMKIAKFGQVVEARSALCSSVVRLVHPYESLVSKGLDELIVESGVQKLAKAKLAKVIKWVKKDGSALYNIAIGSHESMQKRMQYRNWKLPEQIEPHTFFLLSDVSLLVKSCKAVFNGFVGEIFLPITWRALGDSEKEKMFVSRRTTRTEDDDLAEDFICVGCQLCGSPLNMEDGCRFKQNFASLYCAKSSNCLHVVSLIYRPFLLYVWDESEYIPLLVKNKAAELLFGNITAERVKSCYDELKPKLDDAPSTRPIVVEKKPASGRSINFHCLWVTMVKMLLEQGQNSPLNFEVDVNPSIDIENGRYEVLSLSVPCFAKPSNH